MERDVDFRLDLEKVLKNHCEAYINDAAELLLAASMAALDIRITAHVSSSQDPLSEQGFAQPDSVARVCTDFTAGMRRVLPLLQEQVRRHLHYQDAVKALTGAAMDKVLERVRIVREALDGEPAMAWSDVDDVLERCVALPKVQ